MRHYEYAAENWSAPTEAELNREAAEDARWRAADPAHNFTLPCGPEDFAPRPAWRSAAANS